MMWKNGNVHKRVGFLRKELDVVQAELDNNPGSEELRVEESAYLRAFTEAKLDEDMFLKKRAKIRWLKEGDGNTGFFHNMLKGKRNRSRISCVHDVVGVLHSDADVAGVFVNHYSQFVGTAEEVEPIRDMAGLFQQRFSGTKAQHMIRTVLNTEIKEAMFAIGEDKAPGPDGYTSVFFKKAWEVVGDDVCLAVQEFFRNGKMLKEVNSTIIALLPKVASPMKVTDYRPISCCNVLYKCISRIITNRLKEGLTDIISANQSAFVPGRSIPDNILLSQELVKTLQQI